MKGKFSKKQFPNFFIISSQKSSPLISWALDFCSQNNCKMFFNFEKLLQILWMKLYFSCASNLQQDLRYMGLHIEASFIHVTTSPNKQPLSNKPSPPTNRGSMYPLCLVYLYACDTLSHRHYPNWGLIPIMPMALGVTLQHFHDSLNQPKTSSSNSKLKVNEQGVCHTVALPFTLKKSILRLKKNIEKSNVSPCKNIIFKKKL